jgi:hypothetical protein
LTPTEVSLRAPEAVAAGRRPDPRGQLRRVRTLRLAPAYVAGVVALRVAMCLTAGAVARTALVHAASTNVANLTHGRLATLVTSAFVLEGRACLPALLVVGAVLGVAELAWGGLVLAAVFVYGHVVATVLVFAGLLAGLSLHRVCARLANAADVGPSYGGVAVLGALLTTPTLPHARRWRIAAAVIAVAVVLLDRTFTDVGHLLSLLVGFGVGALLPARRVSTRPA